MTGRSINTLDEDLRNELIALIGEERAGESITASHGADVPVYEHCYRTGLKDGIRLSGMIERLKKYRGNSVVTAPTLSNAPKDMPRRRYMLSMHHEGIISSEQFDDVQKERERRSNIEFDESGVHRKKTQYRAKLKISEGGSISFEQEPD